MVKHATYLHELTKIYNADFRKKSANPWKVTRKQRLSTGIFNKCYRKLRDRDRQKSLMNLHSILSSTNSY